MSDLPANVVERPSLRDTIGVFEDRTEAGEVLAEMLAGLAGEKPVVLTIPAGGVPVAAVSAKKACDMANPSATQKAQPFGGWAFQFGSPGRTRTADPVVNSHLLYQLSYRGVETEL